jgi:aspartate kinase
MKFGGRTLSTAENIRLVCRLIHEKLSSKPVVIISALADVTDQLDTVARKTAVTGKVTLDAIRRKHELILQKLNLNYSILEEIFLELEVVLKGVSLLKELTPRTLDYVLSFGERFAVRIISAYLEKQGVDSIPLDAFKIGLLTDSNYGNAKPLPESTGLIRKNLLPYKKLPIITGFIGKDKKGEITTLGRDGSDYTASFIGAALNVNEIQIWRNLPGIMTADPAIVKNSRLVNNITLEEASELVHYANGVLHPYMLAPAIDKCIPVRILNVFDLESRGTLILNRKDDKPAIKLIAYKKDVILVNIVSPEIFYHRRLAVNVFEILARYKIFFHLLASSEISISFVTNSKVPHLKEAVNEISSFANLSILKEKGIICVIGEGIKYNQKAISGIFDTLSKTGVKEDMIIHNALKTNFTFIVGKKDINKTVNNLHKLLFN